MAGRCPACRCCRSDSRNKLTSQASYVRGALLAQLRADGFTLDEAAEMIVTDSDPAAAALGRILGAVEAIA